MTKRRVLLLFSLVFFTGFIFFSYLVAKEKFTQLNFDTTVKFQDKIPRGWDLPFSLFSILGLVEITGFFWLILVIAVLVKKYFLAALALFIFWMGLFVEVYGKTFVIHPSPPHFFYRGLIKFDLPSYYVQTDYSYPSGHVYRSVFLASFLLTWIYLKAAPLPKLLGAIFFGSFISLMMISRIYLGEHWTSDVIGGGLLGFSLGILPGIFIPGKKPAKQIDSLKV